MELSKIDKNFVIDNAVNKEDIIWYDSKKCASFMVHGLIIEDGVFKRLPSKIAKTVSNGVFACHIGTAGGRLSFETDSPYIAISMKGNLPKMSHMANTGSIGFDLFVDDGNGLDYYSTFIPPKDAEKDYDSIIEFKDRCIRKILIHFPLMIGVDELYIGIDKSSVLNKYSPYRNDLPIVYYGSSITNGGCASRPGNAYPAIVAQKYPVDFVNLGFSGSAHGEQEMAEYIAHLPKSAFVLEYDHNDCSKPELLKLRHYDFYKTIRENNPELPIIIMSAPYSEKNKDMLKTSRQIVLETYEKANNNNDNVYFIDGMKIFGDYNSCALVDGTHPNDFGFVKIAEAVLDILKELHL